MTIKVACANCDGNRFAYPFEVTNDTVVHCEDCGTPIGTIAEISEKIISQVAPAAHVPTKS